MKTGKIQLFTIDELPAEIQDRIIEREHFSIYSFYNEIRSDEYIDTLRAFEHATGTQIGDRSYADAYNHFFTFRFSDDEIYEGIEADDVTGKLLWRWLVNFIDENRSTKTFYAKNYFSNSRKRRSKILLETIEGGWCPFTGICYDADILDPIVDAYTHPEKIFKNKYYSLRDLIEECYESLFSAWENELHYYDNDRDFMLEELRNNQFEGEVFLADGTLFDGDYEPLDENAA